MKKGRVRPQQDVFQYIDMRRGNTIECWPWQGNMSPNPVFCWNKKRLQARKLVYGLKHNIPYARVPQIVMTCNGDDRCCNPHHMTERYSMTSKLAGTMKAKRRVTCS